MKVFGFFVRYDVYKTISIFFRKTKALTWASYKNKLFHIIQQE